MSAALIALCVIVVLGAAAAAWVLVALAQFIGLILDACTED